MSSDYVRTVHNFRLRSVVVCAFAALVALSACGDDSQSTETVASDTTLSPALDLSTVCPSKVVVQTDWWPQAEHGFVYQLLGPEYVVDAEEMSVTGALMSQGGPTGVDIQINAGGPSIGFDPVVSRMYSKPEILLGFMGTDIAVSQSEEFPTIGVVAPFNINPQIIMWDPATYPDIRTISDLKDANVKVLYFRNVAYMRYLTGAGILSEDQVEDSYDGFPEQFVTANGTVAQQGFGTNEPIFYENKLEQWKKPIRYQYLHETGWTPYAQTLAVTPNNKTKHMDCLAKLVPMIQQAQYDYVMNPSATNEIIVDVVQALNPTTQYDMELAMASAGKQVTDRLVSNSPDGTLGSFDIQRVEDFIATAAPIYSARGDKVRETLTATELVTNEFIDPTISLPIDMSE